MVNLSRVGIRVEGSSVSSTSMKLVLTRFSFSIMFSLPLGKQIKSDDVVIGLEEVIEVSRRVKRRFGTAGSFPILLFREAWKEDNCSRVRSGRQGDKLPFEPPPPPPGASRESSG
jgi:hypothetical protein